MTERGQYLLVQLMTYGRLPVMMLWAVIVIVAYIIWQSFPPWLFYGTLAAMIGAALTDLFDGKLARHYRQESRLGQYADPLMDKAYAVCTLVPLVFIAALAQQRFHAGLLTVLTVTNFLRDNLTTWLRSIGSLYHADVRARDIGKFRTAFNFFVICIVYSYLAAPNYSSLSGFPEWFIYAIEMVSIGLSLWSGLVYFRSYRPYLLKEIRAGRSQRQE